MSPVISTLEAVKLPLLLTKKLLLLISPLLDSFKLLFNISQLTMLQLPINPLLAVILPVISALEA
jgi:hypothetical protein